MPKLRMPVLALVVLAAAPLQAAPAVGETAMPALRPLALEALGPALTPHVAADAAGERFVLSWQARLADGCAALRAATLSSTGVLGEVREVARGCDWFVNWADHPKLAVADNGDWVAFWLQKEGPGTYHYGIRVSRSSDQGRSWSQPVTPHDDATLSEHGFVSMAPDGDDRMLLVWLDGRYTAEEGGGDHDAQGGHSSHEGDMSLRSAVINRDGAITQAQEIDARVCSCCWTDLARTGEGRHLVVFRDRSGEEVRDIGHARRRAGAWRHSGTVHADGWRIQACPVNGPGLAHAGGRSLVAWSTMASESGMSVRTRLLDRHGSPLTLEQGPGVLGRVDAAAFAGGFLVSWLGAAAEGASRAVLRLGVLDDDLTERARIDVADVVAGHGVGVPRLAVTGDTAMLVWTEAGEVVDGRRQSFIRGARLELVPPP